MAFLNKSYGKWSKVDKPVMVPTSYEDNEDEDEDDRISTNNYSHNNYNVVSDFDCNEETKENVLDEDVEDKIEVTPKIALKEKVVCAMKYL